jgi:hypothetical protein
MTTPEPAAAPPAASTLTASAPKQKCFVIAPIGKDGSDVRKKSDNVLKYIVENALGDKYEVIRADDIRQPGTVTVQIIEQLLEAALVVADLSERNANVYYELAIRHAVKKPVVHLITKGQEAPFDVNQMRYIPFDITDPGSIEKAKEELRDNVRAIEDGKGLLTPIQFTQFVLSAPSGQGQDRNTAMIVNTVGAAMSNISEELKNIRELIGGPSLLAKPAIPLFLDPSYRASVDPKYRSLADMMGTDATDDFIVELQAANRAAKAQAIRDARAAKAHGQEQEKTEKKD